MPNPHINQNEYEPVSTVEEAREHHMRINSQLSDADGMIAAMIEEREESNDTEKELV